jgi:hypothetical protein
MTYYPGVAPESLGNEKKKSQLHSRWPCRDSNRAPISWSVRVIECNALREVNPLHNQISVQRQSHRSPDQSATCVIHGEHLRNCKYTSLLVRSMMCCSLWPSQPLLEYLLPPNQPHSPLLTLQVWRHQQSTKKDEQPGWRHHKSWEGRGSYWPREDQWVMARLTIFSLGLTQDIFLKLLKSLNSLLKH